MTYLVKCEARLQIYY